MRIAQRGSSSTSSGFKAMDRFRMSASNASHTLTQSQTAITSGSPYNEGFRYVFKILNAGQDAHTSAECSIMHTIEAQDIANSGWNYTSASSYVTLSFWVKSSVTQTHLLMLHTNDTVIKEYNHLLSLTADAWTKVTLVIPGHADIVMNDDNGTGLQIIMYGALGTAYTSGSTVILQDLICGKLGGQQIIRPLNIRAFSLKSALQQHRSSIVLIMMTLMHVKGITIM